MSPSLADICEEFGVEIVAANESARRPGQTCAGRILQKVLLDEGEAHLRDVLTTIIETQNNKTMLVRPVILAVSDVLRAYPSWYGGKWLEVFDNIELSEIYETAKRDREGVAIRAAIASRLIDRLRQSFEVVEEPRLI